MGIGMWLRPERPDAGERLDQGSVAWRVEVGERGPLNIKDTPLLFGVDPYGHTIFNHLQMQRQLPQEVEYLRRVLTDPESLAMLDELERLMRVAADGLGKGVGRYLWFLGD